MNAFNYLSSIDNFKKFMVLTVADDDEIIERFLSQASRDIEHYTKRKLRGRAYDDTTFPSEITNGDGSSKLFTKQFPIISVSQLYDDTERTFGSGTLKASTEFLIFKEQGIIQLFTDAVNGTRFRKSVGNVKLLYTAGYDDFNIISNVNNKIDFEETISTELTGTIAVGVYTAAGLATAIETAMDAAGASSYTVTYDYRTGLFKITSDLSGGGGTFKLLTNTGTNVYRSIATTIGFVTSADNATAASQEGDFAVLGVPEDLTKACNLLMGYDFERSRLGAGRLGETKREKGDSKVDYHISELPVEVTRILNAYRRAMI